MEHVQTVERSRAWNSFPWTSSTRKTITWRGEEGEREGEEGEVGEWISCILHKGRQTSLVLVHESKSLRRAGVYSHFRKPLLVEQVPDPYHLFGIVGQHTNVLWLQPPGHKHLYLKGGGERYM